MVIGNAHTYPSGPAILGNTSGTHLSVMVFSWAVAFRIMSSLDSNLALFSGIFNLGNSQKSHGAMSGE
jgi:hypothetical protein